MSAKPEITWHRGDGLGMPGDSAASGEGWHARAGGEVIAAASRRHGTPSGYYAAWALRGRGGLKVKGYPGTLRECKEIVQRAWDRRVTCPHCGAKTDPDAAGRTGTHDFPPPCRQVCPGSGQEPREGTPAPRAAAGQPCPNGCTHGYPPHEEPVLIEYAYQAPGAVEGADGQLLDNDAELYCPSCWDYMGNDRRQSG